ASAEDDISALHVRVSLGAEYRRGGMRLLTPVLLVGLLIGTALTVDEPVRAESDDGRIEAEHSDIAEPSTPPPDTRPRSTPGSGGVTILAAPAGKAIEDFRYDELVLEGTAAEVCAGRLHTGSSWAFHEIVG